MLLLASSVCGLFKWRQFEPEVILLEVGWYLGSVATLQECFDKLGRYGPRTLSRLSVQMAPIRTGSHLACGRMVLYLRFSLSYRDVEELLAERGISVDHVTLWRWVQRYAPELERRLRQRLKATN